MNEDEIQKLNEISAMMSTLNEALEVLNRVMADPDNPDPDDIAYLDAFANGTLNDEGCKLLNDEWLEDEFVDDGWEGAWGQLPWRMLVIRGSDNPPTGLV